MGKAEPLPVHAKTFVDAHEAGRGLTVTGKGLSEYEALQDDDGTIAATARRGAPQASWVIGAFLSSWTPGLEAKGAAIAAALLPTEGFRIVTVGLPNPPDSLQ